ncbi:MAG: hypothetical protein QOH13_1, partial [Thermoleophilaceae bacterium]|nr:hypothetical protein [Thermoleophilaceae bacterium]
MDAPLGASVLARRLRAAKRLGAGAAGAGRLGRAVLDRRRPKLLAAATRLAPRRPVSATAAVAAPESVQPEPLIARPEGMSEAAARWLFFGEKPAEMLPFLGGPAVGGAGEAGDAPARAPRRAIARGKVLEGPAPAVAPAPAPPSGPPPSESAAPTSAPAAAEQAVPGALLAVPERAEHGPRATAAPASVERNAPQPRP